MIRRTFTIFVIELSFVGIWQISSSHNVLYSKDLVIKFDYSEYDTLFRHTAVFHNDNVLSVI